MEPTAKTPAHAERKWMVRVERTLGAVAAHNHRRPARALLLAVVLAAVGGLLARGLSLNANLVDLLPESFQSVQDVREMERRFGALGWVVVVGEGGDAESLQRFADDLTPRLEALPGIRYVESKRPSAFFRDRALYFLSEEDLKEVHRRLEARLAWERRQANPLYVDLLEEEPPSLDFSDLEAKYGTSAGQRLSSNESDYYLDPAARRVVLLAKPETSSADLAFSRRIIDEVQGLLAAQDLSQYGPGFRTEITGTFQKKLDQQGQIARDIAVSSAVALALMLLYLVLHFRGVLAVGLVLTPVGAGLAWTYGLVAVLYGQVNLLTGFLGAILGGLGIEHGIHLLGRYLHLRGQGESSEAATRESFTHTGGAALVSALVAALTFFVLGTSRFRAFREFGVIAGLGMLVLIVSYVLVLPALLGLASRWGWKPGRGAVVTPEAPMGRLLVRRRGVLTAASAALLFALLTQLPGLRFDYDFGALEDQGLRSFVLDREVNRIIGYSQSPVVMLTDTPEEEQAVVRELQARQRARGDASTIDFVASLSSLVPERQREKQALLQELSRLVADVPEERLSPEQRADLVELRRQAEAAPYAATDLPPSVRQQFQGVGNGQSGFVLVYPAVSLADGAAIRSLAREVRGVQLPGGERLSAAGEPMVLADILEMVTHEAPLILGGATLAVLLAMWATLGGLRLALLCLTPTVVSLLALLGLMPLMGLEFNYLNILVIPVLIGTTVDAGVHLLTRLASPGSDFVAVYSETGRAITGGLLTSAVGFGALFLADHPGLNSIGALANLGFGTNLLIMLVAFPALLLVLSERRLRRHRARLARRPTPEGPEHATHAS
ncbi:efflux RND transporter permease subunit [Pyxidicoccus xibeiensis]|uniref:efflux RND transporter permease subunit n=1 Tax=Pyxidicoccus xibeiensis TaxID=2906759 RepID=UPI0020A82A49|nr:MMPL family transporter [Pyxidicoccus xibeiensis]MCP3136438.1 MMPL family transporter [Pyxidicoccus xibeiensis]